MSAEDKREHAPERGQIYRDNDPRETRRGIVVDITASHVSMLWLSGRTTSVRRDRLAKSYTLEGIGGWMAGGGS